jgi:hypothetical protein
MDFHGIDEFMRFLKTRYDRSERKQDWRALSGRDHLRSGYDTFIFTDESVYQIKAAKGEMAAVAREIGGPSPDLLEAIKGGAPIPLGVVSRTPDMYSVIMFGMQQYSSDISDMLKREYYSSKQDQLQAELDRRVSVFLERPEYRRAYRSIRQDQEGYFG